MLVPLHSASQLRRPVTASCTAWYSSVSCMRTCVCTCVQLCWGKGGWVFLHTLHTFPSWSLHGSGLLEHLAKTSFHWAWLLKVVALLLCPLGMAKAVRVGKSKTCRHFSGGFSAATAHAARYAACTFLPPRLSVAQPV